MVILSKLQALSRRISSQELFVLIPLLLVIGGGWAFMELADEVGEGSTKRFDEWAVRAMRRPDDLSTPLGPTWLQEMGRDITALGGIGVLALMIVIVAGFLWQRGRHHMMWLLLAASGGGLLLSSTLKYVISRPRPDFVPHLSKVYTSSFPSGHSMLSAVVYLTLGTLVARSISGRASKIYCIAVAAFLTFIVGLSRIYMGVHYPTDVLAGWTAGLVWALGCWTVSAYLQRRGAVEQPLEDKLKDREIGKI
ncbi:MAG TPA: phosphatase PAP2 family protein [Tepidisphaeraceae bacterium]|jgi:undecaprenyl-diphosphatase